MAAYVIKQKEAAPSMDQNVAAIVVGTYREATDAALALYQRDGLAVAVYRNGDTFCYFRVSASGVVTDRNRTAAA